MLLVQKLCKVMPYYDKFCHKDAHENVPSTACLIFFVKLKTENQLIRFEVASDWYKWYVVRHPAKCHWSGDWPMASSP